MSLPRSLSVKQLNGEWLLLQQPIKSLDQLRSGSMLWREVSVVGNKSLPVKSQQFEIELVLDISSSAQCGIRLATGKGHEMEIGYDASAKKIYIDRSKTANQSFHKSFAELKRYEAPLLLSNNQLRMRIFFDQSIVTVFAKEGEVVLTTQIFPDKEDTGIELFSINGKAILKLGKFWMMKTTW